jgi:hypothetical protein
VVESALLAANARKTVLEESAFEVALEGMLDEGGISVLAALRCLPEERGKMTLHQLMEHRGLGLAAHIGSRHRGRAGTVLGGMGGVERVERDHPVAAIHAQCQRPMGVMTTALASPWPDSRTSRRMLDSVVR